MDPQAEEALIDRFARVWLWHFLGAFLFLDASGVPAVGEHSGIQLGQ